MCYHDGNLHGNGYIHSTLFFKNNDDRAVCIQSLTSRRLVFDQSQLVADWLLTVDDYSELVADQWPIDR